MGFVITIRGHPGLRHSVYENWNADLGLVLQRGKTVMRNRIAVGTRVRGKTAAAVTAVPRRLLTFNFNDAACVPIVSD